MPDEPIVHEQEDDQLVNQPRPDGADEDIEEFFHGWENPPPNPPAAQLRRSLRISKPTEEYRLFRVYPSSLPELLDKSETDEAACSPTKTVGKQNLTFQEALSSKEGELWRIAMDDEYASLMKNNTWNLVPPPPGRTSIKCRWVYDIKPGYEEFRNAIRLDSSL